ncbi:MAG: adenylate/guanylate cyclase domain-containing protein [Verrucomicrobiota bacterium]
MKAYFQALRKLIAFSSGGILGALLAGGLGILFIAFQFGRGLIHLSYDLPYVVRPHIPIDQIVIVYMDDESHEKLKQPYLGSWDRSQTHARLLERLKADGAKAVVFDIVFSGASTNAAADAHFAQAIKDFGHVVLGADATRPFYGMQGVKAKQLNPPLEMLMDAAAALGTVGVYADQDLAVREHSSFSATDDLVRPLSWAAAELLEADTTKNASEWPKQRWVNYYGPPGHLPNVSYYRALDTNELAPGFFRNKVVFVGSRLLTKFSGERKDEYRSPYSFWLTKGEEELFMPGVEIQATMFVNLMRGDWLSRMSKFQEVNSIILLGLLFGFGLALLRPFFATVVAAIGVGVVATLAYALMTQTQYWFASMIVIVQILAAYLWSVVFNSVNLYVQKRLMTQSLSMYVSPAQVKQIIDRPDILKPGAVKQELSILFSDIANFTSMSEGMDSDQLAYLMNSYFEAAVTKCIHQTHGTVVKFIGDAIFAIWNAPEKQPDHHERACRGALLLRDETSAFKTSAKGLEVRTRVGVHCGVANVGNFGSSNRIDYTAIGENINLASRMEGLNKYVGTDVLITGDAEQAVRGRFVTRFLGRFRLKGFAKAVDVHELIALPEQAETSRPWRDAFAETLQAFREKKFDAAEAGFKRVLEIHPGDGPAKFYLKHLHELHVESLPADWSGEVELKEK